MKIDQPGVYEMTDEEYHADPCAVPSLSASIIKVLDGKTAKHAWVKHPRLNPNFEPEHKTIFDLGSCAHALLLGQPEKVIEVTGFDNWKKDAAKARRDEIRASGRFPCLSHEMVECLAMARAARLQLDRHEEGVHAFTNGEPELVLIWIEGEGEHQIMCRAKLDWLFRSQRYQRIGNLLFDYKSVGVDAGPEDWGKRQAFDQGCDIQDVFYCRGLQKVLGIPTPRMKFVVQENYAPYALAVHDFDDFTREMAGRRIAEAMLYWSWCLRNKAWPGYKRSTYTLSAPPWQQSAFMLKYEGERSLEDKQADFQRAIDWLAPDAA
jgi:hypothetical protein